MNTTASPADQREHFYQLLKQFDTAMLVTHAGDGSLRARPMALAQVESAGRAWFVTHVDSAKAHEIEADTRVHLICQKNHSIYLAISGHASLVVSRTKINEVWQEPYKVWFPEGKTDPNLALISVDLVEAEYWDNAGAEKVKYLFESAKAYLTGTTPKVVEGDQHGFVKL